MVAPIPTRKASISSGEQTRLPVQLGVVDRVVPTEQAPHLGGESLMAFAPPKKVPSSGVSVRATDLAEVKLIRVKSYNFHPMA